MLANRLSTNPRRQRDSIMTTTTIRLFLRFLFTATCVVCGTAQDEPAAQIDAAPVAEGSLPDVKTPKPSSNEESRPKRLAAKLVPVDAQREDRPP